MKLTSILRFDKPWKIITYLFIIFTITTIIVSIFLKLNTIDNISKQSQFYFNSQLSSTSRKMSEDIILAYAQYIKLTILYDSLNYATVKEKCYIHEKSFYQNFAKREAHFKNHSTSEGKINKKVYQSGKDFFYVLNNQILADEKNIQSKKLQNEIGILYDNYIENYQKSISYYFYSIILYENNIADHKYHKHLIIGILITSLLIILTTSFIFVFFFKNSEKEMAESLERYRTVADFTYNWEYWLNPNGQFEYISPACEKITGYSPQEFISNPLLLENIIHEHDKKAVLNHIEDVAYNNENFHEEDFRIITKNGEEKWISHFCRPVHNKKGEYIGKRASNRDITERRKYELAVYHNEVKFRTIFNSSATAIFILNLKGQIIEANKTACLLSGYNRKQILGKKPSEISTSSINLDKQNRYDESTQSRQLFFGNYLITSSGSSTPIESIEKIIVFEGNKAISCIVSDITQRIENQKQIMRTIIETEERERERFAKDLHDGMGALLSSINIYLDILKLEDDEEKKKELMQQTKLIINDAILSAKEIANNLRPSVLSKFGFTSSLKAFIDKLNKTDTITIHFNHNTIESFLDEEIEIALFRIVNELINNTLKHSGAKNIYLSINLIGKEIVLEYKDDGKGFNIVTGLHNKESTGLKSLHSRVNSLTGKLILNSKEKEGFNATISIPKD